MPLSHFVEHWIIFKCFLNITRSVMLWDGPRVEQKPALDDLCIHFDDFLQWCFEMTPVLIAGIQKEDEGMYTCRVQNEFGSQEVSAFITVTGIGGSFFHTAFSNFTLAALIAAKYYCFLKKILYKYSWILSSSLENTILKQDSLLQLINLDSHRWPSSGTWTFAAMVVKMLMWVEIY